MQTTRMDGWRGGGRRTTATSQSAIRPPTQLSNPVQHNEGTSSDKQEVVCVVVRLPGSRELVAGNIWIVKSGKIHEVFVGGW